MELTRRDAVRALGVGAAFGGAGLAARSVDPSPALVRSLKAVAETVYPSEVTVTSEFIETYIVARFESREGYIQDLEQAVAFVDSGARRQFARSFASLDRDERDSVLRAQGLDGVRPRPDGTDAEQARYYLVDGLLLVLAITPKGGKLIDSDNPTGYPGGTEIYQQPPS